MSDWWSQASSWLGLFADELKDYQLDEIPLPPINNLIRIVGLCLVLICVVTILLILRLRDAAAERREALRLKRLAEACADLVRLRDGSVVLERMVGYATSFIGHEAAFYPAGTEGAITPARRQHILPLQPQEGELIGSLSVTVRKRLTIGERATLTQLTESATAALETIALLRNYALTVAEATTSRLEAENARRELETILSSMSDAMLALDLDCRLTYSNPNAAILFGSERSLSVGKHIRDLLPEDAIDIFEDQLSACVTAQEDTVFYSCWPSTSGTETRGQQVWVMVRVFPHSAGCTLYMQDVTRQMETEEQLRQTARMDALGQLTGGIAHDFNNLLTVISGNLGLLSEMMPDNTRELQVVGYAQYAADSAASLTQKLLAFARRQPLSPRTIDVSRLVDDFSALLRRTLGPHINIQLTKQDTLWKVRVDAAQLESAILNLAINARDAMQAGGTLNISLFNRRLSADDCALALVEGDYVQIEVTDTGNGIAPEALPYVFEPFFTTKPIGSGTGLGLSMVYGFAKQSGGHASIVSQPGGTTVQLLLPRGSDADIRRAPRSATEPALQHSGERVLVVEDEPMVRQYIDTVLTDLGYRVTAVADGLACLDALKTAPCPDLLLTDVLLPGPFNGEALAKEFYNVAPGRPVVFMSGYIGDAWAPNLYGVWNNDLLRKPFTSAELARRVSIALDRYAPGVPIGQHETTCKSC